MWEVFGTVRNLVYRRETEAKGPRSAGLSSLVPAPKQAEAMKVAPMSYLRSGFMLVDFDKKIVRQTRTSGDASESPIRASEVTGTQLVLQGIENGHGWSMAIHRDSGPMTTVAVGEELSFTIIGACTAP
jgi:hypothetical protein